MMRSYLSHHYDSDFEFAAEDFQWTRTFEKFFGFEELKFGWDGEHAIPPKRENFELMRAYLNHIKNNRLMPPPSRVLIDTDGTLIAEWQTPDQTFELEISGQGEVEIMTTVEGEEPVIWPDHVLQNNLIRSIWGYGSSGTSSSIDDDYVAVA